jgi:small-conductance mechanosensitive channel
LNKIASEHPKTFEDPAPTTYFKGFVEDGNLMFQLLYWSTFSDTLLIDHEVNLKIFETLQEEGIQAPLPVRRIISEK